MIMVFGGDNDLSSFVTEDQREIAEAEPFYRHLRFDQAVGWCDYLGRFLRG